MGIILALDNFFFIVVQLLLRAFRMSPFTGANIFYGAMYILLGFWILDVHGKAAPAGFLIAMFWTIGTGLILAIFIKGRDPVFVEKFIVELYARYTTPWHSLPRRLVRIIAMSSTMLVLFYLDGFLLPLAFICNGCTAYSIALCFSEYEEKHKPKNHT